MRAYFTASIVGKKYHLANYKRIIQFLTERGVDVAGDHILNTTEEQIHFETREERVKIQKKLEQWVMEADFIVVEASFPSISVGYEIALAVHRGKPVLVLYSEGDSPSLIIHNEEEKLVVEKYTTTTLPTLIDDFINYYRGESDTRFTFFITSKIASFLEKQAKKNKVPKSVYLRNLITQDMKNNKT
ncbi:MAG: hypothetical protein V1917_02500 [Candidatus Gottesmanbacteria bacterium]